MDNHRKHPKHKPQHPHRPPVSMPPIFSKQNPPQDIHKTARSHNNHARQQNPIQRSDQEIKITQHISITSLRNNTTKYNIKQHPKTKQTNQETGLNCKTLAVTATNTATPNAASFPRSPLALTSKTRPATFQEKSGIENTNAKETKT